MWQRWSWLGWVIVACGSRTGLDGTAFDDDRREPPPASGAPASAGGGSGKSGAATGGLSAGGTLTGGTGHGGTSAGGAGFAGVAAGGAVAGGTGGAVTAGAGGVAGGAGEPSAGAAGVGGADTDPPIAVEVAAGAFHSCVRFDDGSLRCWGGAQQNGLGLNRAVGDDETPAAFADVAIGGRVVQLAASWYRTCALLSTGRLRCFGNGNDGTLGYGNEANIGDDEAPASAGDVNVGARVLQVTVGPYHTCAVVSGGKVRCWGKNNHFQLGNDNPNDVGDDELPSSVGFVDVGGPVKQVAAGYEHTCALLETGVVRCWGTSLGGQLGYGKEGIVGDDETPASAGDVDVGGPVRQIAAGAFHTCALLASGKVRCWGRGDDGRLGYGNSRHIGDDESPASAGDVELGGLATQLSGGDYATCALLVGGKVRCWGLGADGELGYANTQNVGDSTPPVGAGDVDVGASVAQVDVGFRHVCAVLEGGTVRCWGRASSGELGYGNVQTIGDTETPASAGDVRVR